MLQLLRVRVREFGEMVFQMAGDVDIVAVLSLGKLLAWAQGSHQNYTGASKTERKLQIYFRFHQLNQ